MKTDEEIKKEFIYKCFDAKEGDGLSITARQAKVIADYWIEKFHTLQEEYKKELIEKIGELRHELGQERSIDGANEIWKEGHTKCLNEVINIIKQ